jgi:aminoglycoside phosphotransferase (APT) family kinase protein
MLAELERRAEVRKGLVIPPYEIDSSGHGSADYPLPDGSMCCITTYPHGSHYISVIDHVIDGKVVWGQVSSKLPGEHRGQVARVVGRMHVVPDAFVRLSWKESHA